jgi:uncharacterized protein YegJ (DUF2314 family)
MGLLSKVKGIFSRKKDEPIHAFVFLRARQKGLDAATLERIVSRELGIEFSRKDDDDPEGAFVVGESPLFVIKLSNAMILVNDIPAPYMENPEKAARSIPELRVRKAVAEHTAWLSVDWMGDRDPESLREGYRTIGRIAAGLADDDCVAIYSTSTSQLLPVNAEALTGLQGDDPLGLFSEIIQPPVVNISGDDPRMQAAVEEARRRWPEFVEAYTTRSGENFAVKAPISDGRNTEYIWIEIAEIDGDNLTGDLGNDPVDLQFMKHGSRVRTTLQELNDWAYIRDGELIGGFTVKVLQEAGGRG